MEDQKLFKASVNCLINTNYFDDLRREIQYSAEYVVQYITLCTNINYLTLKNTIIFIF